MFNERDFADVLREIREDRKWSQEELAKHLDTSKQVISRYENRQRTPKISVLAKYADALNVSLEYMMGLENKDARLTYTLLRDGRYDELADLLGMPSGSIRPLPVDEEASVIQRVDKARVQHNRYTAQLKLYISSKLPSLDANDVAEIKQFIDSLAKRKK